MPLTLWLEADIEIQLNCRHFTITGVSNLRGSVPNVSRLIPRAQHHNSESSLADFQTAEEPVYDEQPKYTR